MCEPRHPEHERRSGLDRRSGQDRRQQQIPVAVDRRQGERRRGERRRQVDPTTCEKEYTADELEFITAIEQYKRRYDRPFPTWTEVLEVVRSLGYAKPAKPGQSPPAPVPFGDLIQPVVR